MVNKSHTSTRSKKPGSRQRRNETSCGYAGPATISDGVASSVHDIELHITRGENAKVGAWHVRIAGSLPHELRTPHPKALSVLPPDGRRGVGTLVDPHLIRGAGEPPRG